MADDMIPITVVVDRKPEIVVVPVRRGAPGPPGPPGPPGEGRRWYGEGPPRDLPNAVVGDEYLDTENGDLYQLR